MVSINCITYNHEKFISKAIEGFLNQNTDFIYEILIHDDASTDRTAEIIKNYELKYPKIIKAIYQTENQYSKKDGTIDRIQGKRMQGKYVAICEGDDYWTDSRKLQKQIDYLENNPDCTLCFHNAEIIDENDQPSGKLMLDQSIESRSYTAGDLAVLGFIPTASKVYRRSAFANPPEWYFRSVVGDYPSQLIISSLGYAYYINEVMSNYRHGSSGSASDRYYKLSLDEKINYVKGFIEILDNFNKFSEYKYSNDVEKARIIREIQLINFENNIELFKEPRYQEYYNSLGISGKLKLYLRTYFQKPYFKLAEMKNFLIKKINK